MLSHLVNLFFHLIIGLLIFYFLVSSFTSQHWSIHLIITLLFLAHPIHTEVVASLKNREELLSFIFGLSGIILFSKYYLLRNKLLVIVSIMLLLGLSILSKESGIIFLLIILVKSLFVFFSSKQFEAPKFIVPKDSEKAGFKLLFNPVSITLVCIYIVLRIGTKPGFDEAIVHLILTLFAVFYVPIKFKKNSLRLKNYKFYFSIWVLFLFSTVVDFFNVGLPFLIFTMALVIFRQPLLWIYKNIKIILNTFKIFSLWGFQLLTIVIIGGLVGLISYFLPRALLEEQAVTLTIQQNPLFDNTPFYQNLLFFIKTIETYFIMLIYPVKQLFYYGFNMIPIPDSLSFEMIFILLLHAGLALLGLFSIKANPLISFAIGIYLFGLGIFSNLFLPITGIVGERLMFIPSFGFIILLVVGLFKVLNISISNPDFKTRRGIALLAILISGFSFYSFKTINRNSNWKSRINLFTADIPYLKNSARANLIIADEIHQQLLNKLKASQALTPDIVAAFEDAAFYYQQAYNVDTTAYTALNNLGHIQFTYLEKPQAAISTLTKGLNLRKNNYQLTNNLGKIYENTGNLKMAYKYYLQTMNLRPEFVPVWSNLGIYHFKMNNVDSAIFYLSKVLNAEPNHPEEAEILGDIMVQKKDIQNALNFYNFAAQLNPSNNILITKIENLK